MQLLGPAIFHDSENPFVQSCRQRRLLAVPVERNRLADIVDHNPTRVAVRQMFLERLAESQLGLSIQILVQAAQEFLAFHDGIPLAAQHRSELVLARQTDKLICHTAVLEDLETGDGIDAVFRSQVGAVVHVDLDDPDARDLRRHFFQQRRESPAGAAPIGVEVDQDGRVRFQDQGRKFALSACWTWDCAGVTRMSSSPIVVVDLGLLLPSAACHPPLSLD